MNPLLIGQAPGPNTNPDLPLYPYPTTSTGGRLLTLTGIKTRHEYLQRFDRVNLLYQFPGSHRREDRFPMHLARAAAQGMRPFLSGREVVLVGRNVAEAFGYRNMPFHEWSECRRWDFQFACIPHPSGRNRWYNTPSNLDEAQQFWRDSAEKCCLSHLPVR